MTYHSKMTDGRVEPDRRERKKQITRAALLRSAVVLFRERGIYGTRIADITAAADVGKGVFYNYFETKEALLAELMREALDLLEREFLMSLGETPSLAERVDQLSRLHEEFFERYPDQALLFHQSRGLLLAEPSTYEDLRSVFRDYLVRLSRWLPPPCERTAWSQDVLLNISAAVGGAVAGYRSFRLGAGLPIDPKTVGRILSGGVPHLLEEVRRT